jgi:hypothetical protein
MDGLDGAVFIQIEKRLRGWFKAALLCRIKIFKGIFVPCRLFEVGQVLVVRRLSQGGKGARVGVPGARTHLLNHSWAAQAFEQLHKEGLRQALVAENVAHVGREILVHHQDHLLGLQGIGNNCLNSTHHIVGLVYLSK